jgi:hypothetical protein
MIEKWQKVCWFAFSDKPDSADSDVTCSDYDSDDNLSVIIPTQVNQRCISGR